MIRTSLDGVPVLITEAPGLLRASLVFRAGASMATFRDQQVPHLVEHLVLSEVTRGAHEINGSVTGQTLCFDVVGTPSEVARFLEEVCARIRDLPAHRLEHEARIVTIEASSCVHPALGSMAVSRYGMRGPGLVGVGGVPASETSFARIETFVRRFLVRGNAVLSLTGPLPEGLRLDLREGPPAEDPRPAAPIWELPMLLREDSPAVCFSIEVPDDESGLVLQEVLLARLRETLRHDRGLAYGVECDLTWAPEGKVLVGIIVDGDAERTDDIAQHSYRVLQDLAAAGPCAEELELVQERIARILRDPASAADFLLDQAVGLLRGRDPRTADEVESAVRAVSATQLQETTDRGLRTLVMVVPGDPEEDPDHPLLPGIPDRSCEVFDDEEEVPGRTFSRRLLTGAPWDLRVRVGEQGISVRVAGAVRAVAWDDLVGIAAHGDARDLIPAHGSEFTIWTGDLRHGRALRELIDTRRPDLLFTPEDVDEE